MKAAITIDERFRMDFRRWAKRLGKAKDKLPFEGADGRLVNFSKSHDCLKPTNFGALFIQVSNVDMYLSESYAVRTRHDALLQSFPKQFEHIVPLRPPGTSGPMCIATQGTGAYGSKPFNGSLRQERSGTRASSCSVCCVWGCKARDEG